VRPDLRFDAYGSAKIMPIAATSMPVDYDDARQRSLMLSPRRYADCRRRFLSFIFSPMRQSQRCFSRLCCAAAVYTVQPPLRQRRHAKDAAISWPAAPAAPQRLSVTLYRIEVAPRHCHA